MRTLPPPRGLAPKLRSVLRGGGGGAGSDGGNPPLRELTSDATVSGGHRGRVWWSPWGSRPLRGTPLAPFRPCDGCFPAVR